MKKLLIMVLGLFLAAQVLTGCGQREEQEMPVIKPQGPVSEPMEQIEIEEEESMEEEPAAEDAKTVGGSAIDKAEAIQEAQESYQSAQAAVEDAEKSAPSEVLMIADFNSGDKPNNVGTNFGGWNKDPADPTQWCKESFDNATKRGDTGFSMKLDYSVDSPNPAYNGFWMMLPNLDASKYDELNFWVKGDGKNGYTTVFKLELKNSLGEVGRYYVSNVTDQWQEISIPLSAFRGLTDLTSLRELVIVFEDRMATNKKGVINIDDVSFVKN